MSGKRIGYIRVSTTDQNPDRQLEGLFLDETFIDYASAKSTNRPQLQAMLKFVRKDDIIFVHSMDRLARNLRDLKNLVDELVLKKVQVNFIKENLQFNSDNSAVSTLVLHLMGAFAEFEYAFIRERQREGIEIAKREGRFKGSALKLTQDQIEVLKSELSTGKKRWKIARDLGISRPTLYRYITLLEKLKEETPKNGH